MSHAYQGLAASLVSACILVVASACIGGDATPTTETVAPAPATPTVPDSKPEPRMPPCPVTPSAAISPGFAEASLGALFHLVTDAGVLPFLFDWPDSLGRAKGLWVSRRAFSVDASVGGMDITGRVPLRFDEDGALLDRLELPAGGTVGTASTAAFAFVNSAPVVANPGCFMYRVASASVTEAGAFLAVDEQSLALVPSLSASGANVTGRFTVSTLGLDHVDYSVDATRGVADRLALRRSASAPGGATAGITERGLAYVPPNWAGEPVVLVAAGPGGSFESPQISADGGTIAFTSRAANPDGAVAVVGTDGTGLRAVDPGQGWDPRWSPDGRYVAFVSERDRAVGHIAANSEIYLADLVSGGVERLTRTDEWEGRPRWSPDGTKIMFVATVGGRPQIRVLDLKRRVTAAPVSSSAVDAFAEWSPDGEQIVFTSNRDGGYHIYVANADGTSLVQLTSGEGSDWAPSWSPDGSQIAFISTREGLPEVFVIRADGSGLARVTQTEGGWVTAVQWVE